MSTLDELLMCSNLEKNHPGMSREAAEYLARIVVAVVAVEPEPVRASQIINTVLTERVRDGDEDATRTVREAILKYRPAYEKAVSEGADPVVALALAFPIGEICARQKVEQFQLIDGK